MMLRSLKHNYYKSYYFSNRKIHT